MADNPISGMFSSVFGGITIGGAYILLIIFIGVIVLGTVGYFIWYRRKFDITVKVISERSGDSKVYFDKAAILRDKKEKSKYLKLLKTRVEIALPRNYKVFTNTNKGDYIELLRKSEDEFLYLTAPRIDQEYIIRSDGKVYPMARLKHRQVEGDIYWVIKRMKENKSMIDPEGLLLKLLAYAPMILAGAFMMIILFIFMDKLPEILNNLIQLTDELKSLKGATTVTG